MTVHDPPAPPHAPSPLIGRADELAAISRLLLDGSARLIVLTGPGGVGKTRLATAARDAARPQLQADVVSVDLSDVAAPEAVLPTLFAAIGLPGRDLSAAAAALARRRLLLVIDAVDHISAASHDLAALLGACPGLTALVTSRSALGVYGETIVPVCPLDVPSAEDDGLDRLRASAAVQLFVARLRDHQPGFVLTDGLAPAVGQLVRQLDGLPLALELAAGTIGERGISELARLLQPPPTLRPTGPPWWPPFLQPVSRRIRASYGHLSPWERQVFRQLSLFSGDINLEAGSSVVYGTPTPTEPQLTALTDAIGALIDASLIQRHEADDHDRNFSMLNLVRRVGNRLLWQGDLAETEATRQRYVQHVITVVRRAESELTGPRQVWWLNQLDIMLPDIRQVIEHLIHEHQWDALLDITTALWRYGHSRGDILETRGWLQTALDHTTAPTARRAQALCGLGMLANMLGEMDAVRVADEAALEIAQAIGAQQEEALACLGLGDAAIAQGRHDEAEAWYLRSEQLYSGSENPRGIASAQTNLGNLFWLLGRKRDARSTHQAALRLYTSAGDQRGQAWSLTNIGRLSAELREWEPAATAMTQAITLYEQLGDRTGLAESFEACAAIAAGARDFARAALLIGAADDMRRITRHPIPAADAHAHQICIASTRAGLGSEEYTLRVALGRTLSREDAVRLATTISALPDSPPATLPDPIGIRTMLTNYGITEREFEVLVGLSHGQTDRDIAASLAISTRTVHTHVRHLMTRLQVDSRSAAVVTAYRLGLLG